MSRDAEQTFADFEDKKADCDTEDNRRHDVARKVHKEVKP